MWRSIRDGEMMLVPRPAKFESLATLFCVGCANVTARPISGSRLPIGRRDFDEILPWFDASRFGNLRARLIRGARIRPMLQKCKRILGCLLGAMLLGGSGVETLYAQDGRN